MSLISRYSRDRLVNGSAFGTTSSISQVRDGLRNGSIKFTSRVLQGDERLDILAGKMYGDASLWWILAAASDIGWGLQVPTGTTIIIPNLSSVTSLFSR